MRDRSNPVDTFELSMTKELCALASMEALEKVAFVEDDAERPAAGSRPAGIVKASDGTRYFFKSAPPEDVAAEIFAYRVRTLGKRPVVATAARSTELGAVGQVHGMLQPLLSHAGERLPARISDWSAVQCEGLLREHPWEWLLGNLDTHVDQYVLYGPAKLPLNIDWDHALLDLDVGSLDRFTKRSPAVAPIRNALYDAFVSGVVDLDFTGMRRQVRRIARLDDALLRRFLGEWARTRGPDASVDPTRVSDLFIRRKRRIGKVFASFLRSLLRERRLRRAGIVPLPERLRTTALDAWQRFVIDTLHDRAVIPWLRVYRRALALQERVRSRQK